MDEQLKMKIFDPFFTTKEKGKGTGLGLSTVHGIVEQSGGTIRVHSEPGRGTRFKIYLPRTNTIAEAGSATRSFQEPTKGTETILVVEDEDALCRVVKRSLAAVGYSVLTAASGDEALGVAERHDGTIHLLLTDVVMPRMGGTALAEALVKSRPATKVLFMSGYVDNALAPGGVVGTGTNFIGKPFTATEVARKVRDVLDA